MTWIEVEGGYVNLERVAELVVVEVDETGQGTYRIAACGEVGGLGRYLLHGPFSTRTAAMQATYRLLKVTP